MAFSHFILWPDQEAVAYTMDTTLSCLLKLDPPAQAVSWHWNWLPRRRGTVGGQGKLPHIHSCSPRIQVPPEVHLPSVPRQL